MPPDIYAAAKRNGVMQALARAGLTEAVVEPTVSVPSHSRRRAVFKLARSAAGIEIGFHAAKSHAIIDMHECRVLTPGLFALAQNIRSAFAPVFHEGEKAELHATETMTGFDMAIRWERKLTPDLTAMLARAAKGLNIARLVLNNRIVLEDAAPQIAFGGVAVKPPPHAFLQSTQEGEAALQARVLAIMGKVNKCVADLFSGLGTFALPLAAKAKVHAVEHDKAMLEALAAAAKTALGLKPVTTEARDLFKLPLTLAELSPYDALVLDPPRAGAEAQAKILARSKISRIAYVSCDAASFARDAAILTAGGYAMGPVTPIDQFLWSSHIELVAGFARGRA